MRFPLFQHEQPQLAPEPIPLPERGWLNAMAAIAVGMFVGNWVIGPSLSGDPIEPAQLRSGKSEREILQAAIARPDPFPYRTPTPGFDLRDAPRYGAVAKQQAQAELGSRRERDAALAEQYSEDPTIEPRTDGSVSWQPYSNSFWQSYRAPRSNYRYPRVDRASNVSNY